MGPSFSHRQKIALAIITVVDLMSFCSISLMSLFLPQETATKGETLPLPAGIQINYAAFVTLTTSLVFGNILSKVGAKRMFLNAVLLSRISTILYGALPHVHDGDFFTPLTYVLRGVETAGTCAYFIAGYAIVFSLFPENVGVIRGLIETVVGIGTTIGPAIGELLFTIGGFGLPFFCVGTFVIALALTGSYYLDDIKDNEETKPFVEFIRIPTVLMTCCVVIIASITTSSLNPTLGEHLRNAVLPFQNGYIYLLISIAFALSSPIWGYISEIDVNYVWMMPTGLYLNGISLILLEPKLFNEFMSDSAYFKLLSLCTLGMAMAMALVPTFRCLTKGAQNHGFKSTLIMHGYVGATWTFMYSIGEILGPNMGLVLFKNYNFAVTSAVLAIINIVMATICSIFLYSRGKNRNMCCAFSATVYLQ